MTEAGGSDEDHVEDGAASALSVARPKAGTETQVPHIGPNRAGLRRAALVPTDAAVVQAEPLLNPQRDSGAKPGPTRATEAPSVLLVDERTLTRECFAHHLRQLAPYWTISTASGWSEAKALLGASSPVVLINVRGASVLEPDVREIVTTLTSAAADAPLLPICGRAGAAETANAIRLGLRGLFPDSLDVRLLIGAIHLVQSGGIFVDPDLLLSQALLPTSQGAPPS